jgi:peroxiredoxin
VAITRNAYGAFKYAPEAPQLGDTIADFELPNARGGTWTLKEARAKGPVVIVFYRGFW